MSVSVSVSVSVAFLSFFLSFLFSLSFFCLINVRALHLYVKRYIGNDNGVQRPR